MKYGIKIIWTPLWTGWLDDYWAKSPRGHENWHRSGGATFVYDDLNDAYRALIKPDHSWANNERVYAVVEEYP